MKNFKTMVILISCMLASSAFSQSLPSSQTLSNDLQTLQKINDERLLQLDSLAAFYNELSSQVILTDFLLENIKNGVATRSSCTASCPNGGSVTCSGDIACHAEDGVGCGAASHDGEGGADISVTTCGGPGAIGIR